MKKNNFLQILLFSFILIPVFGFITKIVNTNKNDKKILMPNNNDEVALMLDDNSTVMSSNIEVVSSKREVLSVSKNKLCIVNENKNLKYKVTNNSYYNKLFFGSNSNEFFSNSMKINYKQYIYSFIDDIDGAYIVKYDSINKIYKKLDCRLSINNPSDFVLCIVNDYVYMFDSCNSGQIIARFDLINESFEILDISLPYSLTYYSICSFGTNIYIIGGDIMDGGIDTEECSNKIYKFDTLTNKFSIAAELSIGFDLAYCFNVNNEIVIFAPRSFSGEYINKSFSFNTNTNIVNEKEFNYLDDFCITSDHDNVYFLTTQSDLTYDLLILDYKNYTEKVVDLDFSNVLIDDSPNAKDFNSIFCAGKLYLEYDNSYLSLDVNTYEIKKESVDSTISTEEKYKLCSSIIAGDDMFIFGSIDDNNKFSRKIYKYNLIDNSKTIMDTELPFELVHGTCHIYGDYIYLIGGINYSYSNTVYNNAVLKYNYKNDTIELVDVSLSIDSYNVMYHTSSIYNDKIYIFTLDNIIKFDCATENIEYLNNKCPVHFNKASSVTFDDFIYVIGGYGGSSSSSNYNDGKGIYKFNCKTESFEEDKVLLPYSASHNGSILINNEIYIFSCNDHDSPIIYSYEPENESLRVDEFSNEDFPTHNIQPLLYKDKLFLVGGTFGTGVTNSSSYKEILSYSIHNEIDENQIIIVNDGTPYFELNEKNIISPKLIFIGSSLNNPVPAEAYIYNNDLKSWINVNTGLPLEVGDSNA